MDPWRYHSFPTTVRCIRTQSFGTSTVSHPLWNGRNSSPAPTSAARKTALLSRHSRYRYPDAVLGSNDPRLDAVRLGILSSHEARSHFSLYAKRIEPFAFGFPDFPASSELTPVLLSAIATVASRHSHADLRERQLRLRADVLDRTLPYAPTTAEDEFNPESGDRYGGGGGCVYLECLRCLARCVEGGESRAGGGAKSTATSQFNSINFAWRLGYDETRCGTRLLLPRRIPHHQVKGCGGCRRAAQAQSRDYGLLSVRDRAALELRRQNRQVRQQPRTYRVHSSARARAMDVLRLLVTPRAGLVGSLAVLPLIYHHWITGCLVFLLQLCEPDRQFYRLGLLAEGQLEDMLRTVDGFVQQYVGELAQCTSSIPIEVQDEQHAHESVHHPALESALAIAELLAGVRATA
ncbi:hypothetical protein L1887_61336 [Cichorium endivia]|nr:hypothetical protein L1887_61336 [Cichorium endivia]